MDKKRWVMLEQKKKLLLSLFPDLPAKSGIYRWSRIDETLTECVYIGKAINILERSAQHLIGNESHLDKSIKKHGLYNNENRNGWHVEVEELANILDLDRLEQIYIDAEKKDPNIKLYNIESGGTKGKTIIGERKQRRDIAWRKKEREKVFDELRKWFDMRPNVRAFKKHNALYADAQRLYNEFYKTEK